MKTKRTISIMLVLAMTLVMLPITAQAATDGYYTYKIEDGEATITGVDKSISGDVVVPTKMVYEGIGEYPVVAIDSHAFQDCVNIESIVLPDNIQTIEWGAFSGCKNIKSIQLPANLKYIKKYAFSGCSSLEYVLFPSTLIAITDHAFDYCTNLKYAAFGKQTEFWNDGVIGLNIFGDCPNLDYFICYDNTPAEEYAEEDGLLVKYLYDKMEDPDTGVSIANEEMFTLEQGDTFTATLLDGYTVEGLDNIAAAYDFRYLKNGAEPENPFNVTATIPFPEGYDYKSSKVYLIMDGNNHIEMPVTARETYLEFSTLCSSGIYAIVAEEIPSLPGDVNTDGAVDFKDVSILIRYLAGWEVDPDLDASDVNADEIADFKDVAILLRYLAGYPVELA